MTAHHPWLKHSPEKVRAKLDAVTFDAAGLWHAVQLFLAGSGGDGTIERKRLRLATGRKLTEARIGPLVDELVAEGLMECVDDTSVSVLPWEQPPVEVWSDPVRRVRWTRDKQLKRDGEFCKRVKDRDRNVCRYCGVRVNWSDKKSRLAGTYDHVDPDGDNTFDNVVVACKGCNGRKRDRTPDQAGMPLLRPGQSAGAIAASAAQGPSPEPRARGRDPDRIQIGSGSDPDPGQIQTCAPTRDRTDPNRNQIRSRSGTGPRGAASSAPVLGCAPDGGCGSFAGCECPFDGGRDVAAG